jgi:ribonuclease E
VPLRSGGYLVINQTEALVAVDVNSGRSTRERNIEATALKTNMEAAEEAARQLRLRDLAGLIVIDFIDMDEPRNNRAVEKKLKDCLKDDRARVQMGKISPFGLMEISRQRRRTGVLEGTTHVCEHCAGTGRVRSVESSALAALRSLEVEALKGGGEATLTAPRAVGLYILNEKRAHLARLHQTFGLFITIVIDDEMAHADCQIERTASETRAEHAPPAAVPAQPYVPAPEEAYDEEVEFDDEEDEDEDEDEALEDAEQRPRAEHGEQPREDLEGEGEGRRRRRRRRGRRGDEGREERAPAAVPTAAEAQDSEDEAGRDGRRRRRGRRGGRRMRDDGRPQDVYGWSRPWVPYGDDPFVWYDPAEDLKRSAPQPANDQRPADQRPADQRPAPAAEPAPAVAAEVAQAPAPAIARGPSTAEVEDIWVELPAVEEKPKKPRRARGRGRAAEEAVAETVTEAVAEAPAEPASAPPTEVAAEAPVAANTDAPPAKKPRARSRKKVVAEAPAEATVESAVEAPAPAAEPVMAQTQIPAAEAVAVAVAEPAAEPAPDRGPDPAEITAPPTAPRRGWWRRG